MLIYDGYKYVENRHSTKNIFWRCSRYVRHGCRATAVTSKNPNEFPIRVSSITHSHPHEKVKDCEEKKEIEYLSIVKKNFKVDMILD